MGYLQFSVDVMIEFKSIIALDLETTSLPVVDHNTTKITELALIGCEIEHLRNSRHLPRVLHKLVLLFNPVKTINPAATSISGLSNEMLMNVKPFRQEDVEILRQFIGRLPSPVCLVAHNGNKFDFPILRRAMVRVDKELQSNVYCVDSVKGFRELLPAAGCKARRISSCSTPSPNREPPPPVSSFRQSVCRELFPDEEALSEWVSSQEAETAFRSKGPLKRVKLQDVYAFYFGGRFADPHRAEEDSKALLSCIMRCEGFLDWMSKNAIVFNSIEPLF